MDKLKNKKILIVDDEKDIRKMIENALWDNGYYNIFTAGSCGEAKEIVNSQTIQLCILDVGLPDGDGFELFEEIRSVSSAPAIFLTARGEAGDRIRGLGLGADDYVVKPFLLRELILRINAVLKRTYRAEEPVSGFALTDRRVDFEKAAVICEGGERSLTPKEYILLKKLYENKNKIVTNDALCLAAWGDEYYGYENTLMVHIRRLRKKIEPDPSRPKYLITAKGLGYKLVIDDE